MQIEMTNSDIVQCMTQRKRSVIWMRILTVLLVIVVLTISATADARRFGGGRSFGRQSPSITNNRSTNPPAQRNNDAQNARNPQQNAAQTAARRPFGGMLGSIVAGLGLAALFHWLGFGPMMGEVLGILMLVVLAFIAISFISRLLKRPEQQAAGGALGSGGNQPNQTNAWERQQEQERRQNVSPFQLNPDNGNNNVSGQSDLGSGVAWGRLEIPQGFDVQGFEQVARSNFMRLQKAWDAADMGLLRTLLTDDMYNEMRKELDARHSDFGGKLNQTDVVTLDVKLLGIEDVGDAHMASVEYKGMIREDASAGADSFHEIWNLTKNKADSGNGWLLAGIQVINS